MLWDGSYFVREMLDLEYNMYVCMNHKMGELNVTCINVTLTVLFSTKCL